MAFPDEDQQGALAQAQGSMGEDPVGTEGDDSQDESIFGPGTSAPKLSTTLGGRASQWGKYALQDRERSQAATAAQAGAGQKMIDAMNNATTKLQGLPFGPSPAEKALTIGAAMGQTTKTGRFGETLGNTVGAMANMASEERKANIQKQMLLAQYGIQTAGAQMTAAQKAASAATAQQRADAMSGNAAQTANARMLGKGIQDDGAGGIHVAPGADSSFAQLAYTKLYGQKARAVQNANGSIDLVSPFTGTAPPPGYSANTPPPATGPAHPTAAPAPAAPPSVPGQPAAAPGAAPAPAARTVLGRPITQADFPSFFGVAGDPKTMIPGTLNDPHATAALATVANSAFSPENFSQYLIGGGKSTGGVSPAAYKENLKTQEGYDKASAGAQEQNYNYQHMLDQLPNIRTGGWQAAVTPLRQAIHGWINSSDDPNLNKQLEGILGNIDKVNSEAAFNKEAMAAGTLGLTSRFGNRVLLAEFQSYMKSQPGQDLPEGAIKYLIANQIERNMKVINEAKLHGMYVSHGGDQNQWNNFYSNNFDPYTNSPYGQAVYQIGQKRVAMAAARERFAGMSPAERQAYIADLRAKQAAQTGAPAAQ
jgi:hypothetical protein